MKFNVRFAFTDWKIDGVSKRKKPSATPSLSQTINQNATNPKTTTFN